MGNQELLSPYKKTESRPAKSIKTIEQRNEEISWEESGTKSVKGFGGELAVKARSVLVELPDKHLWQYGLFYPDGSIKKGPAIYDDKEKALGDGVDIAKIEIGTLQQED